MEQTSESQQRKDPVNNPPMSLLEAPLPGTARMGAGAASQPSRVPSPGGGLGMLPLGGPASAPSLTYANP